MEAQDSDKPDKTYPTNYQPLSSFKRKKTCKAVSFGTLTVNSPVSQSPKFESMMKNILDKINFFAKTDIIPLSEKPTRMNHSNIESQESLKNQPKKEGPDRTIKASKLSKKAKKNTLKPDQLKPQKVKITK